MIPLLGVSGSNARHGVHAIDSLIDEGDDVARFVGAVERTCSFDAETPVATAAGAIPISEIDVDDRFYAVVFAYLFTAATGLLHLRARDLAPSLGRFLSADTVQPNALGSLNNPLGTWLQACMLGGVLSGVANLAADAYGYQGTPTQNATIAANVMYNVVICGAAGDGSSGGGSGDSSKKLITKLQQSGIKHNPQAIVRITELPTGKIVFLETGNETSGLKHILNAHGDDFLRRGISLEQIPDLIMEALGQNKIVGHQGSGVGRPIYEVVFHGDKQHVAITVGSNGYIVGANPASIK